MGETAPVRGSACLIPSTSSRRCCSRRTRRVEAERLREVLELGIVGRARELVEALRGRFERGGPRAPGGGGRAAASGWSRGRRSRRGWCAWRAAARASRLSRPALETLAIVAYRQPVSRPEIDAVRGVNSEGVLDNLLERRLLRIGGRKDAPGRPFLYETTREFLVAFGLRDLGDLPKVEGELVMPPSPSRRPPTQGAARPRPAGTTARRLTPQARELNKDAWPRPGLATLRGRARLTRAASSGGPASQPGSSGCSRGAGPPRGPGHRGGASPGRPIPRRRVDGAAPLPAREPLAYVLLHKPRGYVTSRRDPAGPAGRARPRAAPRVRARVPGGAARLRRRGAAAPDQRRRARQSAAAPALRDRRASTRPRSRARARGRPAALARGVDARRRAGACPRASRWLRGRAATTLAAAGLRRRGASTRSSATARRSAIRVRRLRRVAFGPLALGALPPGRAAGRFTGREIAAPLRGRRGTERHAVACALRGVRL